nr:hypothetical protein [Tanacetum cinerariifolium]
MARSSTKELFTPFEEPRNESEEEVTEAMTKPTIEEYIMKTQEDYGSRISKPKIDDKAYFELKGQFLKELHDNNFSGTDNDDAIEHIEYAIQAPLNNLGREIKKVNQRVYVAQRGRYRETALVFYQQDSGNPSYQERRQTMEESLSKFMAKSAKRHDENSNLIKEIRTEMYATIRNQGASIKALEIQIGQMSKPVRYAVSSHQNRMHFFKPSQSIIPFPNQLIDDSYEEKDVLSKLMDSEKSSTYLKKLFIERPRMGNQTKASTNTHDSTILEDSLPSKEKDPVSFTIPCFINNICFEKALADFGASVSVMPYSTFTNLCLVELAPTKLIVKLIDKTIKHPKGIAENVLVGINKLVFPVDFVVLDMPEDIKVPLILERPFLSTAHAKNDMFKRKITLKVRNDKIMLKSDKPTSNIIKRDYALGLKERMKLDLEARIMGETLILNRSLDQVYGDYIELNDLNKPLGLRRNQVEDLGPTIENGEVVDKPMIDVTKTRNDNKEIEGIDEYPSFCNVDRKIHIDCAYNLQFSCMIDQDLGEVIVGKPFCREICVKAKQFDGMITIYNGNDDVTYQMARSHSRFKHLTNAQCNKMRPLLKISARDQLSGISHPYQKLKSFYKGVMNLGPEYVRDAKMK